MVKRGISHHFIISPFILMLHFFRKYHKWFSLFATLFIFIFAVSGMVLNHRELLSGVDVNRELLPPVYRFNNWNLAAVKGSISAGGDSILVFGNIGVWLTDSTFKSFRDLNAGFPKGIDNRKINSLSWSPVSGLYAGTLFGLYRFDGRLWDKVDLFFVPYRLKSLKNELRRSKLKQFNKSSLKWHNVLGSWAILILMLNTATGIFLRPPLLIPIAGERMAKLKYTELDNPNPWFDRFRDLLYDNESQRYLVAATKKKASTETGIVK
jgi:hypothetical protein